MNDSLDARLVAAADQVVATIRERVGQYPTDAALRQAKTAVAAAFAALYGADSVEAIVARFYRDDPEL